MHFIRVCVCVQFDFVLFQNPIPTLKVSTQSRLFQFIRHLSCISIYSIFCQCRLHWVKLRRLAKPEWHWTETATAEMPNWPGWSSWGHPLPARDQGDTCTQPWAQEQAHTCGNNPSSCRGSQCPSGALGGWSKRRKKKTSKPVCNVLN